MPKKKSVGKLGSSGAGAKTKKRKKKKKKSSDDSADAYEAPPIRCSCIDRALAGLEYVPHQCVMDFKNRHALYDEVNAVRVPSPRLSGDVVRSRVEGLQQADPDDLVSVPRTGISRSRCEALVGQYSELLERRQAAVGEDAEALSEIHSRRAALRVCLGDLDGAQQDARRSVELRPSNAAATFQLGYVFFKQENYRAAAETFLAGLQRSPGNARLALALAKAMREESRQGHAGLLEEPGAGERSAGVTPDVSSE